jgi:hypothetical protein
MNTMNLPGFTAEASLCRTEYYYSAIEGSQPSGAVYPARLDGVFFPCIRYRCVPHIGIYGDVHFKCSWVNVCV